MGKKESHYAPTQGLVIPADLLDQLLAGGDAAALQLGGLLDPLKKALAGCALNAEMDHHLGHEDQAGNNRNGEPRPRVRSGRKRSNSTVSAKYLQRIAVLAQPIQVLRKRKQAAWVHATVPTLLAAIDISKHRHEVRIAVPGKKRRRRLTIENSLEDCQRLSQLLQDHDMPGRSGFEATGNYHRTLAHHLGEAGFELKLVSSIAPACTREALHNTWDKNAPKDAQVILHMLQIGAVLFYHDPLVTGVADIQELSKTHKFVSRAMTEMWHRSLTHYLPLYFPKPIACIAAREPTGSSVAVFPIQDEWKRSIV